MLIFRRTKMPSRRINVTAERVIFEEGVVPSWIEGQPVGVEYVFDLKRRRAFELRFVIERSDENVDELTKLHFIAPTNFSNR